MMSIQRNAPVIAAVSFKGGCGRSTLIICLGTELALRGYRVLLIDLANMYESFDPSLTSECIPPNLMRKETSQRLFTNPELGVAGLVREIPIAFDAVNPKTNHLRYPATRLQAVTSERQWQPGVGLLHWIPSANAARHSEEPPPVLRQSSDRNLLLTAALASARREYDVILLDTNGADIKPASYVADHVLILVDPKGIHSIKSYPDLRDAIDRINREKQRRQLPPLKVAGVVFFKADAAASGEPKHVMALHPEILDSVFPTAIPYDETVEGRLPVQLFAPKKPMSRAMASLTTEVIARTIARTIAQNGYLLRGSVT